MGRPPKITVTTADGENPQVADKDSSIEQLKNYLKETKEDHFNFHESVHYRVSLGSLGLDIETNGGLNPGVHRFVGPNNCGKTPCTIEVADNFLDTVPNSKAVYIKSEGRLSELNIARSRHEFTTKAEEWTHDKIFVLESNIYEVVINLMRDLVKNNPNKIRYCFIVDSVDALILKNDSEKEISEAAKVAGSPALSKKFLQSMHLTMAKGGHLVLMISQVTAEIKLDPYAKTPPRGGNFSGGNALLHWADFIFEFQNINPSDLILSGKGKLNDGKTKAIGHWSRIVLKKSSNENRYKMITYPVKYNRVKKSGVWREREVGDILLEWGMAEASGAWVNLSDQFIADAKEAGIDTEVKFNGLEKFYEYLESNEKLVNFAYSRFAKTLSNVNSI